MNAPAHLGWELDTIRGYQTPRIGTPRAEHLATRGGLLGALDGPFGFELLEWQHRVADVAMEVTPEGRWAHSLISVVVARQNGKSVLLARRILAALVTDPGSVVLHTAQDRMVPRLVFGEVAAALEDTPDLRRLIDRIRWANGSEEIRLTNGARYHILAPTQAAFRGFSGVGLLVFDEVREARDDAVWSSALYTTRAHRDPQVWTVSNAGDPDSVVLNALRDRGRRSVEMPGSDPTMAYFEWSAHPEMAPDDPEAWRQANPSLGYFLRPERLIEELRTDHPLRFRTEALCQWVDATTQSAVPWADWERCADRELPTLEPGLRAFMAIDIDPNRTAAAVMIGGWAGAELVVQLAGHWHADDTVSEAEIAEAVAELADRWLPQAIAYDPHTSMGVVDRLADRGYPFERVTGADWVVACGQLLDAVATRALRHADQPELNRQVAAAGRRDIGDGSWRMSRLDSSVPIPAAIALARLAHVAVRPGAGGDIISIG